MSRQMQGVNKQGEGEVLHLKALVETPNESRWWKVTQARKTAQF